MGFKKIFFLSFMIFTLSCAKKETANYYAETFFIMSVPVEIKIYTRDMDRAKGITALINAEIKRISDEFSYNEPYSSVSYLNKNAYEKWINVNDEFLNLLNMSKKFYEISGGGFDITFAPLWPLWKEAASRKKLPTEEELKKALSKIGFENIVIDEKNKAVMFKKPLEINLGGILRGYTLIKVENILKKNNIKENLEIDIGANKLCFGDRIFKYEINSPTDEKKIIGVLSFPQGLIISSSSRSHFVEVEGKVYSHILNIKTGYPVENFSNLIIYVPDMREELISPAAYVIMGREKTFDFISKIKGACAIWIDGSGNISTMIKQDSLCKWEKAGKKFLF